MELSEVMDRLVARGVSHLLDSVAAETRIPVLDILGTRKWPEAARARHMFWLALVRHGLTQSEVGRLLGRNNSSISQALRRYVARSAYNAPLESPVGSTQSTEK